MAQERLSGALNRIEDACARIEAAASRAPGASPESSAEIEQLRQAHEALRSKVQGAIAQIDQLLQSEGAR